MDVKTVIEKLINRQNLVESEAVWMMEQLMEGKFTASQMSAVLVGLRMKGETISEITACAKVMRQKSTPIPVKLGSIIDTCGTGGSGTGSFNISTTVAFLLAGGGYKVAKHGNRSMTSKSGSADLLEALGININLNPNQVADCIQDANIGFLFAPALHSSMKNVVPVRKELAVRTVFNLLGPLTNPANTNVQIIGLYSADLVGKIIHVLKELGSSSAYVFSGLSGLDEVCLAGDTQVARLYPDGKIEEFLFDPKKYGFQNVALDQIMGGTPAENADITLGILNNDTLGPKHDIIAINAGFAISAAENCSIELGISKAKDLLDNRVGITAIEKLRDISQSLTDE